MVTKKCVKQTKCDYKKRSIIFVKKLEPKVLEI